MKRLVLVVSLLVFSLLAQSAFALYAVDNAYAKTGFYLGLGAGMGNITTSRAQLFAPGTISGDAMNQAHSFAWMGNIGYASAISPHWLLGFEVGGRDFGYSHYRTDVAASKYVPPSDWRRKVEQWGVDGLITATYYLNNKLNVFAKFGGILVRSHVTQSNDAKPLPSGIPYGGLKTTGLRPEAMLGASFTFANHYNFFAVYDHVFGYSGELHYVKGYFLDVPHQIYAVNAGFLGFNYIFSFA